MHQPVLGLSSKRQKLVVTKWHKAGTDDRLSNAALTELAVEGARAMDRREALNAKRKTR